MLRALLAIVLLLSTASIAYAEVSKEERAQNALALAGSLKKGGNLESAASLYEQIANTDSDDVSAHLELAAIYRKLGRGHDAVTVMKQAKKRQPGNPRVLAQLGYALISDKQSEQAVNVFDELIAMQPDNALAYNGKAVAFDSAGNHFAAQEIYEKALALAPDLPAIQNNYALSMILNDQLNEAIKQLEKLRAESGDNPTIRQNLALAYGLKGDMKRARELNLKDMPAEQADENILFYQHYAQLKKEHKHDELKEQLESSFDNQAEPVTLVGQKEEALPDVAPAAGKTPQKMAGSKKTKKVAVEPVTEEIEETKPVENNQPLSDNSSAYPAPRHH